MLPSDESLARAEGSLASVLALPLDWRWRSDLRKESNAYHSVPKYCFYAQYFHLVVTAGVHLGM